MNPNDIIAAARECIDTPFVHQGRLKGIALDCAGLLVCVAKTIGADYVDQQGYSRTPYGDTLVSILDDQPCLERVARDDMQAGDMLLMRFTGEPQHLAVFTGENVIHSYEAVGKVCEHLLDEEWSRRIVGVYRFNETS